jgi:hypothetical protein
MSPVPTENYMQTGMESTTDLILQAEDKEAPLSK